AGHVQAGDTQSGTDPGDVHDVVEHRGGCFISTLTMPTCLEPDGVHGGIDLGLTDDLGNHVRQVRTAGEVHGLASEALRLAEPVGVHVSDDHHRCAQDL